MESTSDRSGATDSLHGARRKFALLALALAVACSQAAPAPQLTGREAPVLIAQSESGSPSRRHWSMTLWRDGGGVVEWRARDKVLDKVITRRKELFVGPDAVQALLDQAQASLLGFSFPEVVGEPIFDSTTASLWILDDPGDARTLWIGFVQPSWEAQLESDPDPGRKERVRLSMELWKRVEELLPDVDGVAFARRCR